MTDTVRLTAVVKIKNGYLWEAVQKCGGVGKLAEYLGIHQQMMSNLLNLTRYPYSIFSGRKASKHSIDWDAVEEKLLLLIGVGFDEIFPKELSTEAFNSKPKQYAVTQDVPVLSLTGLDPKLLTTDLSETEDKIENDELRRDLFKAIDNLKPQQAQALKLYYGLEDGEPKTATDVGRIMNLSGTRVQQIIQGGLMKLRHPQIGCDLKPHVEVER
jgi:RNA polymerase sigma factor (sigma-70 family)